MVCWPGYNCPEALPRKGKIKPAACLAVSILIFCAQPGLAELCPKRHKEARAYARAGGGGARRTALP